MNRFRLSVPITVIVALALTATAFAQERGRGGQTRRPRGGFGFGRSIDKPTLLGSKQVRGELKIGEEQATKLDEMLAAYRRESRELFAPMFSRDISGEERDKMRAEIMKKRDALRKKTEGKLGAVLEKSQTKRLNEIALQQQGVDGLVSEYVVASLKLSKEQVKKIRAALTSRDEASRKLMGDRRGRRGRGEGGGGDRGGFEETRAKFQEIRTEAEKTALAVLTKEQSEALEKLKGEKFELDRQSLFRGFGGRGSGRGGRGSGERRRPPADDEV